MEANWIKPSICEGRLAPRLYTGEIQQTWVDIEKLGYPLREVQQVCTRIYDGNHGTVHPQSFTDDGPLFIRNNYFSNLSIEKTDHISQADYNRLRPALKGILNGDVLCAIKGDVGRSAIYRFNTSEATINPPTSCSRPGKSITPEFLALMYESTFFKKQIRALALSKSTRPEVNITEFKELKFPLPPYHLQQAIGNKVLKAERLRELAENRWIQAKKLMEEELGFSLEPNEYSEINIKDVSNSDYNCMSVFPASAWVVNCAISDEIGAQYFTPRRVNCRNKVKQCKDVVPLNKLATRVSNNSRKADAFVGLDQIDSINGIITLTTNDKPIFGSRFEGNDILFSRLRPYLNKVAIWPKEMGMGSGSGELLVYRANSINPYYLFFILKSAIGLYQVIDATAGSTHPRVDAEIVDQVLIPIIKDHDYVGSLIEASHNYLYKSSEFVLLAKAEVEALIEGALDEDKLLSESAEIEQWLRVNPSPHAKS